MSDIFLPMGGWVGMKKNLCVDKTVLGPVLGPKLTLFVLAGFQTGFLYFWYILNLLGHFSPILFFE